MAINRYDSPAQDQYRNTYVPLPYEQIMGTVAARQAQMQREQDMLNKTYEDTQNLKYIPGTKDEGYVRDYVSKASDVVNKYYGQDLSDPIVKQQLRREFSNITDKQTIQNIQSSHAAWTQNQKYKAELKAQGLYDPAIDEDPANANFDTRQGVYGYISPSYKNPRPTGEQYFNNIKATDLGASGDYNYSGVTRDKIREVANAKWGEFVNTSEGNLYVKKISKERGLDYTDPNVRKQIGTEYLEGIGQEFTYRDRGAATLDAQVRAAKGKKDEEQQRKNTTQGASYRITPNYDPLGVGKVQFGKKGEILTAPSQYVHDTGGGTAGFTGGSFVSSGDQVTKTDAQKKVEDSLEKVREAFPQLKGMSNKDTYKAYQDLITDANAIPDLPIVDVPGVPREALKEQFANSIINRRMMVMDDKGSSDLRASTDTGQGSPLEDLGYTTQSLKEAIAKGTVTIGGLAQNGPMAGMVQLEVPDKSKKGGGRGTTRKLYSTLNDQFTGYMASTNDVYNNIRSMKHGITPLGYDSNNRQVGIEVVPSIQKDPTTDKWVYEYQLNQGYVNPDGTLSTDDPLHPNGIPTTINRIGDMQLSRLTNSGYINTEINFSPTSKGGF